MLYLTSCRKLSQRQLYAMRCGQYKITAQHTSNVKDKRNRYEEMTQPRDYGFPPKQKIANQSYQATEHRLTAIHHVPQSGSPPEVCVTSTEQPRAYYLSTVYVCTIPQLWAVNFVCMAKCDQFAAVAEDLMLTHGFSDRLSDSHTARRVLKVPSC